MTETTGAFTANCPERFKLGTVGQAGPGVEVRIAEDGEIITRSPANTGGYLTGRRRPPSCWTPMAGCTPATWAPSTPTASSASSTARKSSSSPPAGRTSPRPTSRTTSRNTPSSARRSPTATAGRTRWRSSPSTARWPRAGPRAAASCSRPRRVRRAPRGPQGDRGRDRRRQRETGQGPAGQALAPAAGRVDGRDPGAHAEPEAQAPGHPCQVRRDDRGHVRELSVRTASGRPPPPAGGGGRPERTREWPLPDRVCVVYPVLAGRFLTS